MWRQSANHSLSLRWSVSIKDCTLRVPNETTTLFLLRVIIKEIFIQEEDSELWFVKGKLHTISIGQSTHWDLVKKSSPRRILFYRSFLRLILFHKMRRIFFIQNFLKPRCIWFAVSYSVYQFIGGENDSNSNTEWSQRHISYQTVIKKLEVSNNKPFVKSYLLRYKSHNTISIPKQFIRNNVQQGECLT